MTRPTPSGSQSRFSALRSFDILACDATVGGDTCTDDEAEFDIIYRSENDAFPGVRPRPTAPDLTLRSFNVTDVEARTSGSGCATTSAPAVRCTRVPRTRPTTRCSATPTATVKEQTPDRAVLAPPYEQVRIAELQVFGPIVNATTTSTRRR